MLTLRKRCIGIIMITLAAFDAYAFDDEITHRDITSKAIENSSLNSYLISTLGFQGGVDTKLNGTPIFKWLREGSKLEDSMHECRASNHFHNPLLNWSVSGNTDLPTYIKTYCSFTEYNTIYSNVRWGTGHLSPTDSSWEVAQNIWDWPDARRYYLAALTGADKTVRETNFANTFQALGQVMHLLEDMAVPAHVRNDFTVNMEV